MDDDKWESFYYYLEHSRQHVFAFSYFL